MGEKNQQNDRPKLQFVYYLTKFYLYPELKRRAGLAGA